MSEALPLALFAVLVLLLAAMPWHRPHPNHQFVLELLPTHLEDEQATHDAPVANVEQPEPSLSRRSSQVVKNRDYTGAADKAVNLVGCKSPHHQLPGQVVSISDACGGDEACSARM